jgi:hypothetical protein
MSHEPDPLVALWRDTGRPLAWRTWLGLSPTELAWLRALLIEELRRLDGWQWQHAHRELLEVKAATGYGRAKETYANVSS